MITKGLLWVSQQPTFDGEFDYLDSTVIDIFTPANHESGATARELSGTTFGDQVNHGGTEDVPAVAIFFSGTGDLMTIYWDLGTIAATFPLDILSGGGTPTTPFWSIEVRFRLAVRTALLATAQAMIGGLNLALATDQTRSRVEQWDDGVLIQTDDIQDNVYEFYIGAMQSVDEDADFDVDYYYRDIRVYTRIAHIAGINGFRLILNFDGIDSDLGPDMAIYTPAFLESAETVLMPYVIQR